MNSLKIKWTFGPFLALATWILAASRAPWQSDLDVALLIEHLVAAIALLVVVRWAGRFEEAGWRRRFGRAWLWLAGPIWLAILTPIGLAVAGVSESPQRAVLWITAALLIGFNEETIFRGFLLGGLKSRFGLMPAVLISSAIFGLMHLLNGLSGADPAFLAAQIFVALGTGIVLSLVTLRAGSVWPAVFLHIAADAIGLSAAGGFGAAIQTAEAVSGLVIFGLLTTTWGLFWIWRLRRRNRLELAPA